MSVDESFRKGDRKEVVFRIARSVKILIRIKAEGSGESLGGNPELWKDGKLVYKINKSSGRQILPGTYELRLDDPLTPFRKSGVVITNETSQTLEFEVPVGYVTIVYQNADGSKDQSARVFVGPADGNNQKFNNSDKPIPMVAGRYKAIGWRQKGDYDPVTFNVSAGERKRIVLRKKN